MSGRTPPRSALVFGASGHLGGPVAHHLQALSPQIQLRLVSSSQEKCSALTAAFPDAEVVVASYFDAGSISEAVQGMEAAFVVTPHFLDEEVAMRILATAFEKAGSLKRMVRILGFPPETGLNHVPQALKAFGTGVAVQHHKARNVLDGSGLPVTYLNIAAAMMDNFLRVAPMVKENHTLVWPRRLVPHIDPRDVAEAAASLLLSTDERHTRLVHTVNNGHDLINAPQVALLMTEVFGFEVRHDGTRESFMRAHAERYVRRFHREDASEYMWLNFEHEASMEPAWFLSDTLQRFLGRPPRTLRQWLVEHQYHFMQ
jgi:uncharacterized protein YbjT (DUF2867 family)